MPSEAQREEVDKLRARFVSRTKETYESLMGSELVLVTQTDQVRVLHCIIYHTDFFTDQNGHKMVFDFMIRLLVPKVLSLFESKLAAMLSELTDKSKGLFSRARGADTRYFRKLSELGERMEEEAFSTLENVNKNKVGSSFQFPVEETNLKLQTVFRVDISHWPTFALCVCQVSSLRPTRLK